MPTMRGRRAVDRRFRQSGSDVDTSADVVAGDGSEDGSGDSILNVRIGILL